MEICYVSAEEVKRQLDMPSCIELMREVFTGFATGRTKNIQRSVVPMDNGVFGIMPALLPDSQVAGAKLITMKHDNASRGLPSHQGIVAVFDANNGAPIGVCDGMAITAIRTAAVSALATDLLADPGAETLCILGSGTQAEMHLKAIRCVRPLRNVRVWSRNSSHAERFVRTWQREYLDVVIQSYDSAEEAVAGADVICTVTPSSTPILQGKWVKPGAHINAVGACAAENRELDSECVRLAKFVCDSETACWTESGDFLISLNEGVIGPDHILANLGEIVTGMKTIRTGASDITCFESLGLAEEDLTCATYLLRKK